MSQSEPQMTKERAAGQLRELLSKLDRESNGPESSKAVRAAVRAAQAALDSNGAPREDLATARRRVAELESALEARDDFIATLGHELRNPISPIFMQLQHLLEVARERPERVDAVWLTPRLESCLSRWQRFLGTLDRILDVSRISAGRVDLELERVELGELVRDLCAGMERQAASARAPLRFRAEAAVVGTWDRVRLEQIASNLLSNAIRYGAGKPIDVVVDSDASVARLVVRDGGIGIPAEEQENIFLKFDRAGARQAGGFGVGLWIVRKLCLAMNGDVRVESRPGDGATFTVTLPKGPR